MSPLSVLQLVDYVLKNVRRRGLSPLTFSNSWLFTWSHDEPAGMCGFDNDSTDFCQTFGDVLTAL